MTVQAVDERPSWERASEAKTLRASARNATLAAQAIELLRGQDVPPDWMRVALAVAEGGRTWQQIGDAVGMTKFEAAGKFRRLLIAAGLR